MLSEAPRAHIPTITPNTTHTIPHTTTATLGPGIMKQKKNRSPSRKVPEPPYSTALALPFPLCHGRRRRVNGRVRPVNVSRVTAAPRCSAARIVAPLCSPAIACRPRTGESRSGGCTQVFPHTLDGGNGAGGGKGGKHETRGRKCTL